MCGIRIFSFVFLNVFFFLFSCSSPLSTNQYTTDKLVINGGISGKEIWSDQLIFTRASWFQKATLLYEVLLADISMDSPFRSWFSEQEKDFLKNCKQVVVGLSYHYFFAKIPTRNIQDEMRALGFKEMLSVNFERQIFNHSDAARLRPRLYRVQFYCQEMISLNHVTLEVPGHMSQEVAW